MRSKATQMRRCLTCEEQCTGGGKGEENEQPGRFKWWGFLTMAINNSTNQRGRAMNSISSHRGRPLEDGMQVVGGIGTFDHHRLPWTFSVRVV